MKFKFLTLVLFICSMALAQTKGTITGVLKDKDANNTVLPFANAALKGTTIGSATDENGKYKITAAAGDYTLVFSFLGYENVEVPVTIVAGETITINRALGSGNYKLEDVIVKATAGGREKETALLLDQKKAVEIKQSIGAQEMARKGVSDVEEGLTKITGITKVGDRGLFVRGLEDRYNNLLINDLAAPTNNPFTKIIPLDLFPTDIVSVIEVYKTFNPNIYGDFAGGTFNIQTSRGSKSITKLSIGTGFTTHNNLTDFLIAPDADNTKGFFGFNGKDRELPAIFGSAPASKRLSSAESLQSFKSGFNATETKSPLNSSVGILHSEKFTFKNDNAFSYLFSLNFDNTYTVRKGVDRTINNAPGGYDYISDYVKTKYNYKTSTTALVGLNYSSEKIKLTWNTFYIKTTDNLIQDQNGQDNQGLTNSVLIRTNQLDKTDYLNTQLLGEYAITKNQNFKAGISFANTKFQQPDRKFFSGLTSNDNEITVSYGANNFLRQYLTIDGNYFVSSLAEYSLKLGGAPDRLNKLSIGYNGKSSAMESSYRFIASASTIPGFTTETNSIDTHIQNDLLQNKFYFIENSSSTYKVKLNEFNNSGYTNLLWHFGEKWEVNGGVRLESSNRETLFRKQGRQNAPFITKKYDNFYVLPSLNVKYEVTEKANIRLAGSKTYTRPVIMEAFPLTYLNADGTSIQGNSILKNSDNYNGDLKFEYFPTNKEMFAVGVFGKYLKNPIERAFIANATTNTITSFLNSENATLYGLESEFIVGLERINPVLSNFSIGFNGALTYTKVNVNPTYETQDEDGKITTTKTIETFQTRDLQGASKWIVNSDLKYQFNFNKTWSNTISLVYSVFSKRIFAVGTTGQDHTYELPFQKLDLVWGSKLSEHFDLKFSADNLLDPARQLEFGNEGKYKINRSSTIKDSYKKGVGFSLNLSYTF